MLAVLAVLVMAFAIYRSASITVVVLVRPVEKEAGTIDDPPLSEAGEQRAQRLAQMLGEATGVGRIDAIYVTDARRAQQTAAPLADRLGKRAVVIAGTDASSAADQMLREHDGGTVLFVGNSSTVPPLVHQLSGLDVGADTENEHDTLYVISIPTFGRASVLRLRY
jgi:broad specificity phosphatase PhoE